MLLKCYKSKVNQHRDRTFRKSYLDSATPQILKLNNQQRTLMAKHAGVARHAYNWGLGLTKQILDHNRGCNPIDNFHDY